jgi:hypothetical protein
MAAARFWALEWDLGIRSEAVTSGGRAALSVQPVCGRVVAGNGSHLVGAANTAQAALRGDHQ